MSCDNGRALTGITSSLARRKQEPYSAALVKEYQPIKKKQRKGSFLTVWLSTSQCIPCRRIGRLWSKKVDICSAKEAPKRRSGNTLTGLPPVVEGGSRQRAGTACVAD